MALLAGGLPLVVSGATLWVAYSEARRTVIEFAEERVERAVTTLDSRLTGQFRSAEARVQELASRSELATFLSAPSRPSHAAALASLGGIRAGVGTTVLVQVLDHDGRPLSAASDSGSARLSLTELQTLTAGDDSAGIGAIRDVHGVLTYPIVARIASGRSTIGYLVIWQRILAESGESSWIPDLLGRGTRFHLGSRSGPWTDRTAVVPAPDVDLDSLGRVQRYHRTGEGTRLAILAGVAGSDWLLSVDVSEDSVLAAPRRFLRRMSVAAVLVGAVGLAAGLALSRRILR